MPDENAIPPLCERATDPARFAVTPPFTLEREIVAAETLLWEVYAGHLLGEGQTRERATFTAWNLYWLDGERSALPLIALKWDRDSGMIHVVRSIRTHVVRPAAGAGNVVEMEDAVAWRSELVASYPADQRTLADDLDAAVRAAVVGSSRLPLVSAETPLPQFSFGTLAYVPREGREPASRRLEIAARVGGADAFAAEAATVANAEGAGGLRRAATAMFNDTSLTPWTRFVDDVLTGLRTLVARGVWPAESFAAMLAGLAVAVGRHLAVYDLVTFHHRGANYPDLLLADALWQPLLDAGLPESAEWRRGVRALAIVRATYAGVPVPDHPTTPGENLRDLRPHLPRLPDEQLSSERGRTRVVFTDPFAGLAPTHTFALGRSLAEFDTDFGDLGVAVVLERPFGVAKPPRQRDATPLVAHVAYSRAVAIRQLAALQRTLGPLADGWDRWHERLMTQPDVGHAIEPVYARHVVGTVSLQDALRTGDEFRLIRTLPGGLRDLFAPYPALRERVAALLLPTPTGWSARDTVGKELFTLALPEHVVYRIRGVVEYPDQLLLDGRVVRLGD